MEPFLVIAALILAGIIIGALAGPIWKDNRPFGVRGDYIAAILSTVIIGLGDWYLIPAMGFSDTLKWAGVIFEPALGALLVLWLLRKARQ